MNTRTNRRRLGYLFLLISWIGVAISFATAAVEEVPQRPENVVMLIKESHNV